MQYLFMLLFAAGAVGLDQIVKFLVVANIPLHGEMAVIPGLIHLTYAQNTGAAFSMLQGQQWLFAIIFALFTAVIIWEFKKDTLKLSAFDRWCIAAVWAGGLGNMIDRLRLGYVVDMFETEFITFPVFNVADCFITCGAIALIAHLVFCNKEFWKDGKK